MVDFVLNLRDIRYDDDLPRFFDGRDTPHVVVPNIT